jgi:hypothetical protein
LGSTDGGISFA